MLQSKESNTNPLLIKPRNISGFADYSESQNYLLSEWLKLVERNYSLFGFTRLIPRPLELREVLLAKGGIQKQIFGVSRLPNDQPTNLALPFDRTIPLANWVAKHQSEISFPYKRYDIGYSFRGERSQKGRYQGFIQADIDIIGREELSIDADADCIAVLIETISKLGFNAISIRINNVMLIKGILRAFQIDDENFKIVLEILDEILKVNLSETQAKLNKLPFLDEDTKNCLLSIFSYKGTLEGFFDKTKCPQNTAINEHFNELKKVFEILSCLVNSGTNPVFMPCIVRGLDYYTGTVFEIFIENLEHFGSICSGGRYDNLASSFTKVKLPGFGGSIGLTRLFDIATEADLINFNKKTSTEILVCQKDSINPNTAFSIATLLRRCGINTDIYTAKDPLSKQLKYADGKGINNVVIVIDSNNYIFKEFKSGIQQEFNSLHYLINHIRYSVL